MNKRKVALALVAALGINTLAVNVGNVNGQVQIAHAQQTRLTDQTQITQLGLSEVKSLTTSVVSDDGQGNITVSIDKIGNKAFDASNIREVKVDAVKYSQFEERKNLKLDDIANASASIGNKNEIKFSGATQPGIYTTVVTVNYNDKATPEKYALTFVKQPYDYLEVKNVDLLPTGIKLAKANLRIRSMYNTKNNGQEVDLNKVSILKDGVELKSVKNGVNDELFFDVNTDTLKAGDVFTVKCEYKVGDVVEVVEKDIVIRRDNNAVPTAITTVNLTTQNTDAIAEKLSTHYGVDKTLVKVTDSDEASTRFHNKNYEISVNGKKDVTLTQTFDKGVSGVTFNSGINGVTVNKNDGTLELSLDKASIGTDNISAGFTSYQYIESGLNKHTSIGGTPAEVDKKNLIGNYVVSANGKGVKDNKEESYLKIHKGFDAPEHRQSKTIYFTIKDHATVGGDLTSPKGGKLQDLKPDAITTNYNPRFKFDVEELDHGINPITFKFNMSLNDSDTEKEINNFLRDKAKETTVLANDGFERTFKPVTVKSSASVENGGSVVTTVLVKYDKFKADVKLKDANFKPQAVGSERGDLTLTFDGDVKEVLPQNPTVTIQGAKVHKVDVKPGAASSQVIVTADIPKEVMDKGITWELTTKSGSKLNGEIAKAKSSTVNLESGLTVTNNATSQVDFSLNNVKLNAPGVSFENISYNDGAEVPLGTPITISDFNNFKNNNSNAGNKITATSGKDKYEVGIWVDSADAKVTLAPITETTHNTATLNISSLFSDVKFQEGVTGKIMILENGKWVEKGTLTNQEVIDSTTKGIKKTVGNLKDKTEYTFKVVLVKGDKTIAESAEQKATTGELAQEVKVTLTNKGVTTNSVVLGVDPNFDLKEASKAVVYYKKTGTNDWMSNREFTAEELKKDPVDITVNGLESNTRYDFKVVYYKDADKKQEIASKVIEGISTNAVSGNVGGGTISGGSGSSSSTTGSSIGSTTINTSTSNTVEGNTDVLVTLPSGVRYDNGRTPMPVNFKYKGKDGKVVTEKRDEYSNVKARFDGDKIKVEGLVPGKDYTELYIDYTDNNGKTRTLILKNVRVDSNVDSENYLANVYMVVLNRPADENGYHFHLGNLKGKKVSVREFLLNMLTEKEFVETYTTTESKIEALYSGIVARESDEQGKTFWVNEYKKMLSVYGSESATLKAIADRMVHENELKELADKMGFLY